MQQIMLTIGSIGFADILDILLVSMFFYVIFQLLKQTRSAVALTGFATLIVISLLVFLIARTMELKALILIFEKFWVIIVLIFLIVFQNEFKRAMTELGHIRIFQIFFPSNRRHAVEEVVQAAEQMAARHTGALIAIERRNPLDAHAHHGTQLDARVSAELIRTIFTNKAPLHDGAMIVRGDTLVAAGCLLDMDNELELIGDLGTRHRAAISLSEATDAVVVVVSEETGTISIMLDGKMERGLNGEMLLKRLKELLEISDSETESGDE